MTSVSLSDKGISVLVSLTIFFEIFSKFTREFFSVFLVASIIALLVKVAPATVSTPRVWFSIISFGIDFKAKSLNPFSASLSSS